MKGKLSKIKNSSVADSYNKSFKIWNTNKGSGHSLLEKPAIYSIVGNLKEKKEFSA